jgi:transposase InsO family protein
LTEAIRGIHTELDGNPGVRRIWAELVVRGWRVARKRVWRLMRAAGLRGRRPRAWKRTTIAGQRPIDAPYLLGQDLTAEAPNTRWCGDITYSAHPSVMCSSAV